MGCACENDISGPISHFVMWLFIYHDGSCKNNVGDNVIKRNWAGKSRKLRIGSIYDWQCVIIIAIDHICLKSLYFLHSPSLLLSFEFFYKMPMISPREKIAVFTIYHVINMWQQSWVCLVAKVKNFLNPP